MHWTRRRVLAAAGAGVVTGLAGCGGDGDAGTDPGDGTATITATETTTTAADTTTSATTTTADGTTSTTTTAAGTTETTASTTTTTTAADTGIDHPAAAGLDEQPALGPADAPALIVAFEDPSCRTCRRFESRTFPTLKREYVEAGSLRFVYRVFPIVFPWGEPASEALEATYARSEAAFWALKTHYYATQGKFDGDNVLSRTESFLAANTDLDAAAVVADVREGAYDDEVKTDVDAARAAGASATPTFYLFRDGEFRTRVVGAKDASVFAAALGL